MDWQPQQAIPHQRDSAPHAVRSGYMRTLEDDTLEMILEHAGRMPVPLGIVQLRVLGGAMARVRVAATAFADRDVRFMATISGGAQKMVDAARQPIWVDELWDVLRPRGSGVRDRQPSVARRAD